MKEILLILIIGACAASGSAFSYGRKRRHDALVGYLDAMRVLRIRILNSSEPLEILLGRSELGAFQSLALEIAGGKSTDEAWQTWKTRNRKEMECLTETDVGILDEFFSHIGRTGKDEQDALFSMTLERMETASAQAKVRHAESAKTFTALGALAGIAVCILIA